LSPLLPKLRLFGEKLTTAWANASGQRHPTKRADKARANFKIWCNRIILALRNKQKGPTISRGPILKKLLQQHSDHISNRVSGGKVELAIVVEVANHDRLRTSRGGEVGVDFHGQKRSNQTHESKTDPDAKLARKGRGKEAKLSYNGNLLVENRNGLIVNSGVFEANGTAERDAALVMLEQITGTKQVTVGGDKGYDTADFVAECRNLKVTPHVAQNLGRRT
jgi:hypothetical protein